MGRLCALIVCLLGLLAAPAAAEELRVPLSDGAQLGATLTPAAAGGAQPTLVEFSPYGAGTATLDAGPAYNHLLVRIRGTGDSDGKFDALGPRTQADVAEALRWACDQSWSNGKLALNGFSASAITIYNSLWQQLPCVKAAVLGSGTFELYRDLLVPGGISNLIPGAVVLFGIGAPATAGGGLDVIPEMAEVGLAVLSHPTLDAWWRERGFRGDVNHLPILMVDGFFDVESRGAFQAFQRLRRDGAHLLVIGAHEGAPADTDGGQTEKVAWLDRYVRGVRNGVARHPRVQLWMAEGDREALLTGSHVRYDARNWPVPGTRWRTLWLGDETLGRRAAPAGPVTASYPALPSLPTAADPPNAGIIGGAGLNALTTGFAALGDMTAAQEAGASWTTRPLRRDWWAAGPATLDVRFATTAPEAAIWAVVSDVSPEGVPHPVAAGRLSTSFPDVRRRRSLRRRGQIVQPYGVYSAQSPAPTGETRRYRVEFWPIGNRFKAGHRIRLTLVGASAASAPFAPGVNTVTANGSRLLLPRLPPPP